MHQYRLLLGYVAPHWRGWLGIFSLTVLSTAFALLEPWPLKLIVDHVLGSVPPSEAVAALIAWIPGAASKPGLLVWAVAVGLVFFAISNLLNALLSVGWTRVGRGTVYDLARDLFARIQRASLRFHSRHPVGDSLSRVTGDAWCVHTVLDTLLFAPGHALLTLVGMAVIMFRMDPGLTLLALAVAPFMSASAWLFGTPLRTAARMQREIESRIHAHVQQTLRGMPVVQAFAREDVERQRFQEYAAAAIRAHQRGALVESAYGLGSGSITTIATAAVIWLAAMRVLDGDLTVGSTLVFLSYLGSLQGQLAAFAGVYAVMQGAGASIDRVTEVLADDDRIRDRPGATPLPAVRGEVKLEAVSFAYEATRPVLKGVTLDAHPGETIAIVGQTGAGKSTLVGLIPRFFDPQAGRVLIDGRDVRDVTLESLRRQIAVVLQDPFLFPVSVAENIAFGRPDATREDIEAAALAANAHAFIERLPNGYDEILGESGATLSGGERQRLSIARALLRDAPILILDEPTSALDVETEQSLLAAIERLMTGRTTFVIAHRLSTVRRASRIAVLDDGEVLELGTHDALLARNARYAYLYRLQFGGADGAPPAA